MYTRILAPLAAFALVACIAEKPAPCYSSYCSMTGAELAAIDRAALTADEKLQYDQARGHLKQRTKFEKQRAKNIRHYYKYTEVAFDGPDRAFTAHATTPYEVRDPFFVSGDNASDDYILFTHGSEMGARHQLSVSVMYDISEEDGLGRVKEERLWRGYERAHFKDGTPADVTLDKRSIAYCQPVKKLVGYSGDYIWMDKCAFTERVSLPLSHTHIRRALELDLPIELYLTSPNGPSQRYIVPTSLLAAYILRLHDETGLFADDVQNIAALAKAREMVNKR
ncbi:hypothetical protein [Kordiimonas gwangyangensis]|uniref:hypothetical protein n=1 Tax=Kordiimonas gwangyangensis TaxID=288022 RepID=UPI0003A01B0D|nr:hypothetical protein [Kordiimonas gwangyangensis]